MFPTIPYPIRVLLRAIALVALLWWFCDLTNCQFRSALRSNPFFRYPLGKTTSTFGGQSNDFYIITEAPPASLELLESDSNYDSSHIKTKPAQADLQTALQPEDRDSPLGLHCHGPLEDRYTHLRSFASRKPRFLFAMDLYHAAGILPRLLTSIVDAAKFLGPEFCHLSIVEGNSTDDTSKLLHEFHEVARALGLEYSLVQSNLDPKNETNDRIETLAKLRNLALVPLLQNSSHFDTEETTVIFINDISLCPNDILELIHQRRIQNASMACSMDYSNDGLFYDIWVARSMTGDIFFDIPPSGLWKYAKNLLWDDPVAKRRLDAKKPIQVFACWNGMAAMSAKPFVEKGIRFRRSREGECYMGEPTLLAKDLWAAGFGKIFVVPSVWVGYSHNATISVKKEKGFVEDNVMDHTADAGPPEMIEWEAEPPSRIKCPIPSYAEPQWVLPYEGYVDKFDGV